MTESSRKILSNYEVRKTYKQKSAFIDYVTEYAKEKGYSAKVEKGASKSRNIVLGNPETAKVVYTAHYDTCPRLPFPNFITPKNIFIYVLYQIALTIFLLGIPMLIAIGVGELLRAFTTPDDVARIIQVWTEYIGILVILYLMMMGPANPHTANDNTSGVTTLVNIMDNLPENLRDSTAFIFFDLEEVGLVGSSSYAKAHKAAMKDKLLINFDCVSDGKTILFAMKKGADKYLEELKFSFPTTEEFTTEFLSKGVIYPSDQARFPLGVGVAALKKTKRGLLYMNRIHTAKDTVFEEENIDYLTDGAIKLAEVMSNK